MHAPARERRYGVHHGRCWPSQTRCPCGPVCKMVLRLRQRARCRQDCCLSLTPLERRSGDVSCPRCGDPPSAKTLPSFQQYEPQSSDVGLATASTVWREIAIPCLTVHLQWLDGLQNESESWRRSDAMHGILVMVPMAPDLISSPLDYNDFHPRPIP